ncbi:MAG: bifunctional phosphoribosylaminoimidazolecarboxamide formyltransferase/IMP cyclohydrolase [Microthrixaceae bacterium]
MTQRRRALLSVYDKTGVVALAATLAAAGWELLSSGGTAAALAEAGLTVRPLAELTGFGEMLSHRVVTLHPAVHGGLLADRDNPEHMADLDEHGIEPIDLVVANLYPFADEPGIELIDIGGPTMVRAAAKNHAHVGVVVDPSDYEAVADEVRGTGELSADTRRRLAVRAFDVIARYDAQIADWMRSVGPTTGSADQPAADRDGSEAEATPPALPERLNLSAQRAAVLRYGENPHQMGARYRLGDGGCWDRAVQHQGKEMSYLNVYDADAAWALVHSLGDRPAAVVIKHANPCGAAVADDLLTAYQRAHEGDPVSAFGGIVAVNRELTGEVAAALAPVFTEVVVAPGYTPEAREILATKKNLRLLETVAPAAPELQVRSIAGGLLVQTTDPCGFDRAGCTVATERAPTESEWADLELAWRLAARVSSNCIVLVRDNMAVGIGAGQQNRRDAGRIAAEKADGRATAGACASDAFFPFRDGLDAAAEAGATAVIQPGGSVRDGEVIEAANEANMAMVFTGVRHFRH